MSRRGERQSREAAVPPRGWFLDRQRQSCSRLLQGVVAELSLGALRAERNRLPVVVEVGAPAGRVRRALAAALGADQWGIALRSVGRCGVGGETVEQVGEQFGVLHHREVTAGDLDWLYAEQFAGDESFPLWREELVVNRVDERGG